MLETNEFSSSSVGPSAEAAARVLVAVVSPDNQLMNGTIATMWPVLEDKMITGKK